MSEEANRLSALAAGLCQDAGIGIEISPGGWSWDPVRRVIQVSAHDLRVRGPDYCAGVITSEAGHYYLTRHHLFPLNFPSKPAGRALMDALEQPRVNSWMGERYRGTQVWLAEVARHITIYTTPQPSFLLFCREVAAELDRRPGPMPMLPDEVIEALMETREARELYASIRPPLDFDDSLPELFIRYRDEVRPSLLEPRWMPPRWEQLVQLRAYEALRLAEEKVFDVAERLLHQDLRNIENFLSNDSRNAARARRTLEGGGIDELVSDALSRMAPERPAAPWVRDLAEQVFERHLSGERRAPMIDGSAHARRTRSPRETILPPLPPIQMRPRPPTDYDRAYERVADQVEDLTKHLGEILRPRKRLRERAGYPSGRRVDLKQLMKFEADPRRYDQLWVRSSIPDRRNVAISLLVDLSGSMEGQKVESALLGTILLAETLSRLKVPFAITGFQDVLIPLARFNSQLGPETRAAIAEMHQEVGASRPGGNNQPGYNDDGPCLLEAAEELVDYAASDRLLVVVSDGLPEGRRSTAEDLRSAVSDLSGNTDMDLLALGLGPDTEHVERFYPKSVANVPLERFSEEIGRLVEEILIG